MPFLTSHRESGVDRDIQDGMPAAHSHVWMNDLTTLPVAERSLLWLGTACQTADFSFSLSLPTCLTRHKIVPAQASQITIFFPQSQLKVSNPSCVYLKDEFDQKR